MRTPVVIEITRREPVARDTFIDYPTGGSSAHALGLVSDIHPVPASSSSAARTYMRRASPHPASAYRASSGLPRAAPSLIRSTHAKHPSQLGRSPSATYRSR